MSRMLLVLVVIGLPARFGLRTVVLYLLEITVLHAVLSGGNMEKFIVGGLVFNVIMATIALLVAQQFGFISKRHRTKLEASEVRYQQVVDNLRDLVYVDTIHGEVIALSAAFTAILGYSAHEWIGKSFMSMIHADDIPTVATAMKLLQQGGIPQTVEARVRHANGAYIWMEFRSMPVRDEAGVLTRVIGVARDVTAEKRQQADRIQAAIKHERETIIRSFVNAFSHHFRNALASINTSADLMWRVVPPEAHERAGERLKRIEERVNEMRQQLDNLDLVASMTLGEATLLDPEAIVAPIVAAMTPRADLKGVTLVFSAHPGLTVRVNSHAFSEAVRNLLMNAIQHTPTKGEVQVDVTQEGEKICVTVRDGGGGVPSDEVERIFQPFYRSDLARGIDGGGVGLGLTIVRMVADVYGGEVRVENCPDFGSAFTLALPMVKLT